MVSLTVFILLSLLVSVILAALIFSLLIYRRSHFLDVLLPEHEGHLAAPHVLGYGSMQRGRYSAQQQGVGARTYTLQPTSSSVPNPSACGPKMHDYVIRAGGAGATAVQVVPGLLTMRTPLMATHAVVGRPSVAASLSASASRCRAQYLGRLRPAARIVGAPPVPRAAGVRVRISTLTSTSMVMKTLILTVVVFIVSDAEKSKISKSMWRR